MFLEMFCGGRGFFVKKSLPPHPLPKNFFNQGFDGHFSFVRFGVVWISKNMLKSFLYKQLLKGTWGCLKLYI